MAKAVKDALDGKDVRVNAHTIELRLADIWREEQEEEKRAVTRAALWNVVAHTWNGEQHAHASEILGRASASVPQRTIVIRADPAGKGDMSSWISANCHLIGGGDQQVCSEQVDIVATGERVLHVPPLVSSLLLPDMPVAVWWLGHLPPFDEYVETLLEHADRLIVDSAQFDGASDFELVARIAGSTTTAPADLNWARIEEWRAATAMLFDPPGMRERLQHVVRVRVMSGGGSSLGELSEAILYVSWLQAQLGREIDYELAREDAGPGIAGVELYFSDGAMALVRGQRDRGVVVANVDGSESAVDCITRTFGRGEEELIVRLLKRPEADRVFVKTLRVARRIAAQVA